MGGGRIEYFLLKSLRCNRHETAQDQLDPKRCIPYKRYIRDVKAGLANPLRDATSYSCMFYILLCCCEIGLENLWRLRSDSSCRGQCLCSTF